MSKLTLTSLFFLLLIIGNFVFAQDDLMEEDTRVKTEIKSSVEKPSHNQALKGVDSIEYDEEEFVGFEKLQSEKHKEHQVPKPEDVVKKIKSEESQLPLPPPRDNYYLEIGYGIFMLIYLLNYFAGKRTNDSVARKWYESNKDLWEENFAVVGLSTDAQQPSFFSGTRLIKESNYTYKLKASGRVNCVGMLATLELRKRHDLFSYWFVEPLMGINDVLTIDVLYNDDAIDSIVLAVLKKKEEKKYRKDKKDLSAFTSGTIPVSALDSALSVVSEVDEVAEIIVRSDVVAALNASKDIFQKLHITDSGITSNKFKKVLQLVATIPGDINKLKPLHKMVFYFLDSLPKIKLSKQVKEKTVKNRAALEQQLQKDLVAQRHEMLQQKKIEKKQKEREQLQSLSGEALRKAEEKLAKKEAKKKTAKMKIMYG